MRGFLLLLIALAAVAGAFALRRALASDETRIRWLIEDAAEAFNDGRPRKVIETLEPGWYDRTSGVHRDTLFQILVGIAFREKDARTGEQLWSVRVEEPSVAIEVADGTATAALRADFFKKAGEETLRAWSIAVEGELVRGEEGWRIRSSAYTTLEGERPGR